MQFCTENPKLSASAVHSRIESDIDYLLYERACHRPITEFDPEERYQLSPVEQAVLSVSIVTPEVEGVREVVPDMLLADGLWFGISPISSGVFGVPTGLLVTWLVSLVTRPGRVAVVIPDGL